MSELPENFICRPYRGVSVQAWDGPLEEPAVRALLTGREAYRRTEFIVLRRGPETALVRVGRASEDELFSPIEDVEWLAGPSGCAFVESPETDTANATALARAALACAPGIPVCVVEGRYHHVNFIYRPHPVPIRVVEIVPPEPPKLYDMAERVVAFDESLPPVDLRLDPVDIRRLAESEPAGRYLLPCRGSGVDLPAPVDFLDERPPPPEPVPDWTLIGCERSRQFHLWFYGAEPSRRVELCPAKLASASGTGGPTLTKCCLLEEGLRREGEAVVVPWGSSLGEVQRALHVLLGAAGRRRSVAEFLDTRDPEESR